MKGAVCMAALMGVVGVRAEEDVGYEKLFQNNVDQFSGRCVSVSTAFPSYATGDYIISSLGMLGYGGHNFTGILDSFGKMHRFHMKGNQVCATYRMLETNFYNKSIELGTIAPGMLFSETVPPRDKCPLLKPMCNLQGANDNAYVNSFERGGQVYTTTDAETFLKINPETLQVEQSFSFDMLADSGAMPLSTAHPLLHPVSGDYIAFREKATELMKKREVVMYSISGPVEDKANRKDLGKPAPMDTAPYMHSYGLSLNYAVLPRMPIAMKMAGGSMTTPLIDQMFLELNVTSDADPNNAFHIIPLNGSEPFVRYLPASKKLYYVHTVNTVENETGITIDLTVTPTNAFMSPVVSVAGQKNKKARDSSMVSPIERFHLPFDASVPVTSEIITDTKMKTDFPVINPGFAAKPYCYFWANSWFTSSPSLADMGIVKYDVCAGTKVPKVWSRKNWYPTEPKMIPSDAPGAPEDSGVVVFGAMNGETGEEWLITLDAATMAVISEAGPFPTIGFTAHGQFYKEGSFP